MAEPTEEPRGVVVFGGAAGIGRATVAWATGRGADVTLVDTDGEAGSATADELGATFRPGDAGDEALVGDVLRQAVERCPSLAVVTTVGGAHPSDFRTVDVAAWDAELAFNLTTAYVVCATALSVLCDGGRGGAIVLTTSSKGFKASPEHVAYSAAKAGIVAMVRSAAVIGAPHDVRVNAVAPGPTETARVATSTGDEVALQMLRASTPLGRLSQPEDVAEAIGYLLWSAPTVTGQTLHINSGKHLP